MDQERIIRYLEQHYYSKRDMLSRIPLGTQPDAIWEELMNKRRSTCTMLPLTNCRGEQYWYVTTQKMIAASEKIVDTLYEHETEFDPFADNTSVVTLEETFYTSFVEGSQITMQEAMEFLTSDRPPSDIEEQLIANNRLAGSYASSNLCRIIDAPFIQELSSILTEGMDDGGRDFRSDEIQDFSSLNEESFDFPSPYEIPSRMDEIKKILSDPEMHPLIKSALAQAWMILVRPFPEGNERLGRILSNMVLLRAGYTFFSDVSLSALIARKSYGYYEAINNILRSEHEGDLTYFIEYFLELLSRAVDERALRKRSREEKERQAEIDMAHTALVPEQKQANPLESSNEKTSNIQSNNTLEVLNKYAKEPQKVIGRFSIFLLNLIKENQDRFTINEVTKALQLDARQLSRSLRYLKEENVIYLESRGHKQINYRIILHDDMDPERIERNLNDAENNGTDPNIINIIRELLNSDRSPRSLRLGRMLALFLPKGQITYVDYYEHSEKDKWVRDMSFATQLGLVEPINDQVYTILKCLKSGPPSLTYKQKKVVSKMYRSFGDNSFSTEMVIATLDYNGTNATACATTCLHRLTMLRILDYSQEDKSQFRFIVNPRENPQLFEQVS